MTTTQALITLSMLALPLGTSCLKSSGPDTGMDCVLSDTLAGTDTSTWPDGLEATVVAFEALDGTSWTNTLNCSYSYGAAEDATADVTVTVTPGPRSDIYLMLPVEGRHDDCRGGMAQGTATFVVTGLTSSTQTSAAIATFDIDGTGIDGTSDGGIDFGVVSYGGGLYYAAMSSSDGTLDCRTGNQDWVRVDAKTARTHE